MGGFDQGVSGALRDLSLLEAIIFCRGPGFGELGGGGREGGGGGGGVGGGGGRGGGERRRERRRKREETVLWFDSLYRAISMAGWTPIEPRLSRTGSRLAGVPDFFRLRGGGWAGRCAAEVGGEA